VFIQARYRWGTSSDGDTHLHLSQQPSSASVGFGHIRCLSMTDSERESRNLTLRRTSLAADYFLAHLQFPSLTNTSPTTRRDYHHYPDQVLVSICALPFPRIWALYDAIASFCHLTSETSIPRSSTLLKLYSYHISPRARGTQTPFHYSFN
jgi:hypothetical protein